MVQLATLNLTAADVTGQKRVAVRNVPASYSVGEIIDGLLHRMELNQTDRAGQTVNYDARLEREARHLHRSEIAGDALQNEDTLVMHPRIMAGGGRA